MRVTCVPVVAACRCAISVIVLVALAACSDGGSAKYSIGGNVTGLAGTVVLQDNGRDNLSVGADGPFTFPTKVKKGKPYAVTVLTQPAGQTCAVANGSGKARARVTNVTVACVSEVVTYTLGGTISGLKGAGLKLADGAANTVVPAPNSTTFTLPVALPAGAEFNVGIVAQPAGQTCLITNAHGFIAANVTNVSVNCTDNTPDPIVGSYEVAVPGSIAYITLFADGVYIHGSVENDASCGQNDGNGIEYGTYDYDAASGDFSIETALVDTNGKCGLWDDGPGALASGTLQKTGSGQTTVLTLTVSGGAQVVFQPVPSTPGTRYGGFGDGLEKGFTLFVGNVFYFVAETQADPASGQLAGVEYGCAYAGSEANGALEIDLTSTCPVPAPKTVGGIDTNGTAGFSGRGGFVPYDLLDANTLQLGGPAGDTLTRIIPN